MRIVYVCGYCNQQFEGMKKQKTALERCLECERFHRDNHESELEDYRYRASIETYPNIKPDGRDGRCLLKDSN